MYGDRESSVSADLTDYRAYPLISPLGHFNIVTSVCTGTECMYPLQNAFVNLEAYLPPNLFFKFLCNQYDYHSTVVTVSDN